MTLRELIHKTRYLLTYTHGGCKLVPARSDFNSEDENVGVEYSIYLESNRCVFFIYGHKAISSSNLIEFLHSLRNYIDLESPDWVVQNNYRVAMKIDIRHVVETMKALLEETNEAVS